MNAWDRILQHMERRVNPHSFATWFRPTKQEGHENGKLTVSTKFAGGDSNTYYEINIGADGQTGSGQYMLVIPPSPYQPFGPMGDTRVPGTITMTKTSKSTKPPKNRPRPAPVTPAYVPSAAWPMPYAPSSRPAPSYEQPRRRDCAVEYQSCWHICDSAPRFGSTDTRLLDSCIARCDAARNRCQ